MNLFKAFAPAILFFAVSSHNLHAMNGERFKTYARMFVGSDPELIFHGPEDDNDESEKVNKTDSVCKTFDNEAFEQFIEEFISQLKECPAKIGEAEYVELICLFRAIAAYSRFGAEVMPLLATLPLDDVFNEMNKGLIQLHLNARLAFEDLFYARAKDTQSAMMAYLELENDTVLAGSVILFLFLVYEVKEEKLEDIKHYKELVLTANNDSLSRLKTMINKYLTAVQPEPDSLQQLANDKNSSFYHTGARFNIAGKTIADREEELSDLEKEKQKRVKELGGPRKDHKKGVTRKSGLKKRNFFSRSFVAASPKQSGEDQVKIERAPAKKYASSEMRNADFSTQAALTTFNVLAMCQGFAVLTPLDYKF